MKAKKLLAVLMSATMLFGLFAGTIVMPTMAAINGTTAEGLRVPFGSPAITANVGDVIDLTKYGVEFTDGSVTTDGLTWLNTAGADTVTYKSPAILANVGETVNLADWNVEFADGVATNASAITWQKKLDENTVTFGMPAILTDAGTKINFADYPVELTKGNVVAGNKLTWKQIEEVEVPLISFTSPAIPTNVGEAIDLTKYAVEFADGDVVVPSKITWKNGDAAVTSFTAVAKGVTALTATANGVSKTIYVVAKNANEDKYVLYRNDFNSADDVAEMHKSTMGSTAATATYAEGGYLAHNRNGSATATNQSMLFAPEWLSDFGDYRLEASVSVSAYANTGRYFSFLTHGSNTAKSGPYYVAGHTKAGKWFFQKNTSATSWGLTAFTGGEKNSAFTMNVNTYYTYALNYDGGKVTSYFNDAQIMQFAVPDATPIVTGRPGIGFHGIDATADYFEVALVDDSIKTVKVADTVADFTPATKGVTAFNVTDGTTTKTIYVVAKNPEDTEYVLYENDFNEAADLNDLTLVLKGAGTESVANGKFNFTRTSSTSANNRAYFLPEWLCDFGDYTLEMNASVNAQANTGRYIGFLFRGQEGNDGRPYGIAAFDRKKQVIWGDRSTAEGTSWNPNWYTAKTNAYTLPALGTAATYKISVMGDNLTVYFDGAQVASKILPDTAPEMGRPGIMTAGIDFDIDNFKVTITEPERQVAADTFTPTAAGVTEFIATVNGVSKSVYVVAKEADDTEYVLYENNFDSAADLDDLQYVAGNTAANYPMTVADGVMSITRVNSTNGNTTVSFPMWLSDFGDYTIESSIAITAQQNTTRYFGLVFRGNPSGSYAPHYASLYFRNGKWQGQRRVLTASGADWNAAWDNWAGPSITSAFSAAALGTFATYKVAVAGDTAEAYYNGAKVGTYTPTDVRDTGFVGLFITAMVAKMDYFKVTLPEMKATTEEITTFTVEKAGVTALTVKDANGNEKTVYVVAKNPEDTEYVLFETDFNNASDANALTVVEGNATMSVESGALTVTTGGAYVYLPEYLGDFGNYKMEMVAATTAYGASSDFIGLTARGQSMDNGKETYIARVRHSSGAWDAAGYYYRDASGTSHRHSWGGHATISLNSTHTYTLFAYEDLIALKQDANYVFYAEEEKEHDTGYLGFTVSNVTLSVDSIRVTLFEVEKPDAPVSASFPADAALPYGTIAGSLTVNLSGEGETPVDVAYYWGDGEGKLDGYAAFDEVLVKGNTTVTDTIPVGTVVPAGAIELRVYTANEAGESAGCVVIPLPLSVRNMDAGKEVISFQMASDTHIMPKNGSVNEAYNTEHFINLLQDIAKFDPDSVGLFHGGDIVDNGKISEYQNYQEIWNTYSNGLALEGIIGNHEYWDTKTHADTVNNFANYTGIAITPETPYYTKNIGGYDFFFLNSSIIDPSGGNHNIATLGDAQLAWLDEGLAKVDANTPAFIFHHQKFNQIADADALKAILAKYPNAIFMTSHTHTDMNTAGVFEYENDTMCKTANTSSVSYSVYTHYNPNGENTQARAQAYYVEVYEDRVVFRGMDIMTDEWLPSAQFVFWYGDVDTYPTDANLYPAASGEYESFSFDASAVPSVGDDGFTAADTETVNALEGKFNFYYDREGAHYRERDLFDNLDDNDKYNPSGTTTGWSKWVPSGEWLTRTTGKTSGEMFRKIDSLVPLNAKGDELVLENFETTFNVKFANYNGGIILGFRQQEAGHFTTGYYNIVKTMGFVSINKGGMSIASGNDILNKSGGDATNDMYNHFETTFANDLPNTVTVTVRVVGTAISVDIYDYTTKELLHTERDTLSLTGAGKLAYGVSAVGHSIGDIEITKLNGFGAPLDIEADRDYQNGNIELVDMQETDNGYQYTIKVTPDAGYQLRAGSLIVEDKNGDLYVPTRVGFRNGGDASRYTVTIQGEGIVYADFYQPTKADANIGLVGTSINEAESGLRFVHRLNVAEENDKLYVNFDGEKAEIKEYGLLVASNSLLKNPEDLDIETADQSKHVHRYTWPESTKYYDKSTDHVDIAVHIKNIAAYNGQNTDLITRTYLITAEDEVIYSDLAISSYNQAAGMYETATMADLKAADAIVYHGRATESGTDLVLPQYGGTGFTIKGDLAGHVDVTLNHSEYASALNVVIDGNTSKVNTIWLEAGDSTVRVAKNLSAGEHTIQITRSNSNYGVMTIQSVRYQGDLSTPTVNPLQFEFLGDSITAAGGESGNPEGGSTDNLAKSKAHNTFYGYAAQTSRAFGADTTIVARSGQTTAQVRKLFNDAAWDHAANQKDLVVINLGTNDFGYANKPDPDDIDGYADTCRALLADVRAAYPDAYIIWGYGMMFDKGVDQLQTIVETYAAETGDEKILFCDFSSVKNNDGSGSHPDQSGQDAAAQLLTAFVREHCAF